MKAHDMKVPIVLCIGAVVFSIIYFVNRSDNSENKTNDSIPQVITATTTPTPPEAETYPPLSFPDNTLNTSDWKEYTNSTYGFSFKYPPDWEVRLLREDIFLVKPIKRLHANDDGGVHISPSVETVEEYTLQSQTRGAIFVGKTINNEIPIFLFDAKYSLASDEILRNYLYDLGEYRLAIHMPDIDPDRIQVSEQIFLSFKRYP